MKKIVKILSIITLLAICISAVACGTKGDDTSMNGPENTPDARTKVGDKIIIGKYELDGNSSEKEDITWTVIKVEEGRALLLSDLCVSYGYFHDAYEEFTWEDSAIRDKLNKDFYLAAFSDEEKALIGLLIYVLYKNGCDTKLMLALGYLLL